MLAKVTLSILIVTLAAFTGVAIAQHPEDAFVGQKAPELKELPVWINTVPLKLEALRGKVILLDFWAFDCPYCAEALPYVIQWNEKYSSSGLVVIGVHTPRIDSEKDLARLRESVTKKGIKYPVVVDNKYDIWGDYLCNVWPSHFIVDQQGVIQLSHSGHGRYEETEQMIQKLLAKNK